MKTGATGMFGVWISIVQKLFSRTQQNMLRYFDRTTGLLLSVNVIGIAAVLSLILLFNTYYLLPGLKVFGLDEVHYYYDFAFKFKEEGRWANFLLHHALRQVPLVTHSVLSLSCLWWVFFRITKNFTRDTGYAIVIASVLLMGTPYVHQSLWPATLLPTVLTLVILTWLAEKGVSHRVIYLLGGILLFGMLQNFYFMLPLFFLGRLAPEPNRSDKPGAYLFSHFFYWITGAVAGVLFAFAAVYLLTGQVGIIPAAWRKVMPANNLSSLIRNILYVIGKFKEQVSLLWRIDAGDSYFYAFGLVLLFVFRCRFWRSNFPQVATLLAVSVAFFAFSVPLAPAIDTRSLVALSSAMLILLLVSNQSSLKIRYLSVILLLWTGWNLSVDGRSYLNEYKTQNEFVMQKVEAVLPNHLSNYRAVAIFGKVDYEYRESRFFNLRIFTRPIILTLGANDFWDCRENWGSKDCDVLVQKFGLSSMSSAKTVEFVGVYNSVAVIAFGGVPWLSK
jgi:hypothetical protein